MVFENFNTLPVKIVETIRPKKIIAVFWAPCPKKIGSVGRQELFITPPRNRGGVIFLSNGGDWR